MSMPPYASHVTPTGGISQGGAPFLSMIGHLERITKAYLEGEPADFSADTPPAYHLLPRLAYR
jgi:hypothetical protein